jgi:hypothetical protein
MIGPSCSWRSSASCSTAHRCPCHVPTPGFRRRRSDPGDRPRTICQPCDGMVRHVAIRSGPAVRGSRGSRSRPAVRGKAAAAARGGCSWRLTARWLQVRRSKGGRSARRQSRVPPQNNRWPRLIAARRIRDRGPRMRRPARSTRPLRGSDVPARVGKAAGLHLQLLVYRAGSTALYVSRPHTSVPRRVTKPTV